MPPFARRPSALASLFASLSLLTVVACSSSEDAPAGTSPDPVIQPEPDGGPAPESNDVVVTSKSIFGLSVGKRVEKNRIDDTFQVEIRAVVEGTVVKFTSTRREDGALVFTGVPRAPYVLEVRRTWPSSRPGDPPVIFRYPVDGARNVELGDTYWGRDDVTMMADESTKLSLSIDAPEGFENGDTFSWVGLQSYFYRSASFSEGETEGVTNAPAAGDTSSSGYTFEGRALGAPYGMEASGLPVSSANDDLIVHQDRERIITTPDAGDPLDKFRPWKNIRDTETIGVLYAASPNFTNGTTNDVSGTLSKPVTEHLTIDFDGESFAAVREAAGYPKNASSSASISLSQEAGPGPEVHTSVAPTPWILRASAKKKPVDLSCFPNPASASCNPGACAIGCANATDGYIDPGSLSQFGFDAPRIIDKGMRDFYNASYSFSLLVTLPNGQTRSVSGSVSQTSLRATNSPSFSLELGPPTEITVDGKALPWEVSSITDDHAPVIAFKPATKGEPEYNRVEVIDLTPDLGNGADSQRTSLTIATLNTHEASVTIPQDILRSSHVYYVKVSSMKDGWKFAERPLRNKLARTTVFTAPFVFGTPVTE